MDAVPVIDFSAYSLDRERPDPEGFQKLIDNVHQALTTIGFMYLKNFGIPIQKIKDALAVCRQFYALPQDEKLRYSWPNHTNYGYKGMEAERVNPDTLWKDLKEVFNYSPAAGKQAFPDGAWPEFKSALIDTFHAFIPLNIRVMEVMARGLKLEDPHFFADSFKLAGTERSLTTMRTAFYPSLDGVVVKEGQVRCGEHSDYGGITLLYQTQAGLEVLNRDGKWIPAPPIEDTLVVNIGDLMQRWTADKLIATRHRVVVPSDLTERQKERQSLIFFGYPDSGAVIECIDKSGKYPPIESLEYADFRFGEVNYD